MTDKIEPALSAEEWAEVRFAPLSCDDLAVHDDGDGLEFVIYPDDAGRIARTGMTSKHKIDAWDADGMAGVIAVANNCLPDSDPRKITREKIEMLHTACTQLEEDSRFDDVRSVLEPFADALESYLAPEGT